MSGHSKWSKIKRKKEATDAKKSKKLIDNLLIKAAQFQNKALIQYYRAMIARPDRTNILKRITVPVLFIFGEKDNLIPNRFLNPGKTSKVAQVGKDKLPNSKLVMVPKAGHFVQFEKPEEVNKAIRAFIR